ATRARALLGPWPRRPSSTNRRVPMPRTRKHPTEKDALSLLKEDHRKVRGLLAQLAESSERATTKREELLAEIERELKIHTTSETTTSYPSLREAREKPEARKL